MRPMHSKCLPNQHRPAGITKHSQIWVYIGCITVHVHLQYGIGRTSMIPDHFR